MDHLAGRAPTVPLTGFRKTSHIFFDPPLDLAYGRWAMKESAALLLFATMLAMSSPLALARDPAGNGTKAESISDQLVGYWAIDAGKTRAALTQSIEDAEGNDEAREELAFMIESVAEMARSLVLQFSTKNRVIAHTDGGQENFTFEIKRKDGVAGEFSLILTEGDDAGEKHTAKCQLSGKNLHMTPQQEEFEMVMIFERLDNKTARTRIAEIVRNAQDEEREGDSEDPQQVPATE